MWIIGRTLAGDSADRRRAVRLMRQYTLTPPGGLRRFPAGCRSGSPVSAATPTGLAFLDALGRALKDNPPPSRDRPLLQQLARVGVGPNLRPEQANLSADILAGLVSGTTITGASLPAVAKSTLTRAAAANHGWAIPAKDIGDYRTDYRYRAGVAAVGLGANSRPEAIYPTALQDSSGRPLDGHASYRVVFARGHQPPARAFWSLTLYDASGYLVANPEHRYSVGSSHPPLVRRPDGSVVVVVQAAKPTDPRVNWLPAPAGPFRLNLRLYWPQAQALDGSWQPPPVQRTGS